MRGTWAVWSEAGRRPSREGSWDVSRQQAYGGERRRTTSFAILMSTQSELNSHTSRNKISAASASADASSGVAMVKRNTMSSP